jgi:hypothetical protein
VYITITLENEDPIALDDYITVTEGGTVTILEDGSLSVLDNDTDPDGDTLIATIVEGQGPSYAASFTLDEEGTGTFIYTHDGSETTSDSFVYQASDGNGGTITATVYITIVPVNDPPVANDDSFTLDYNSVDNELDVLLNDNDPEADPLTIISIVTPPENGLVEINEEENKINYTTEEGYTGPVVFEYEITDGNGGYDTAIVTIDVVKHVSVGISKPKKEYLYILDKERFAITSLLAFIEADTIIIGPITLEAEIDNPDFEVGKVEYYIDGVLKSTVTEGPSYGWLFNERHMSISNIRVVAYDITGENTVVNEMSALILNFGFFSNSN